MGTQAQTLEPCSGVATYLSLMSDWHDGKKKNVFVFSGKAKELVPVVVEQLMVQYNFPAIPFEQMGNIFIAVPEDDLSIDKMATTVNYINKGVFQGSPIEAGRQMKAFG